MAALFRALWAVLLADVRPLAPVRDPDGDGLLWDTRW
jgi:hypothetical protein